MIKAGHPQEGSEAGDRTRGVNLVDLWFDHPIPNDETQICSLRFGKNTLCRVYGQACYLKALQNVVQMLEMLLPSSAVDDDFVEVGTCIALTSSL